VQAKEPEREVEIKDAGNETKTALMLRFRGVKKPYKSRIKIRQK
jgi:hypothetical protein